MPPSSTLGLGADFFLGHKARPARRILGAQKEKGAVHRKHTSATVPLELAKMPNENGQHGMDDGRVQANLSDLSIL